MSLFQKNHGAISVFLIIILVPCMLVSSIFVDISRVELSKAVAESSADLALSTLMTNYDYDLSQFYGLMGSCQDIDKYYSMVSGFYDQALHSDDVTDDEIKLLYQRVYNDIAGRFSDETISDLLQIQNKSDGAVVSAIDDANMHNSTILQKQVVEFMKYRAPIVIIQDLIELLKAEAGGGSLDASKEAVVNEPMTEAQEEYYESESELLKEAHKSYWALREYTRIVDEGGFSREKLDQYRQTVTAYRDAYREINQRMIQNLYNTEGLQTYTRPKVALDAHTYDPKDSSISYVPTPSPSPSPDPSASPSPTPDPSASPSPTPEPEYHVTAAKANELTTNLTNAMNTFDEKRNALTNAGSDLMSKLPGEGTNESYKIQWWVQMNGKINAAGSSPSSEVRTAGDAMVDAYAKVAAMVECIPDEGNWDNAKNLMAQAKDKQSKYLSGSNSANDAYINTVKWLENVSAQNINQIRYQNLSVNVNGTGRTIPAALSDISSNLKAIKEEMDRYIACLNDVIDGNQDKDIPSMGKIKTLVTEYWQNLDTWETKAKGAKTPDGGNTKLSKEHQSTITKIRDGVGNADGFESAQMAKKIEISEVEELENRLRNARTQLQAMSDAINAMTYGGVRVMDITDYPGFKSAAASQVDAGSIPLANGALIDYASGRFSALFHPDTGDVASLPHIAELPYSPLIHYLDDRDAVPPLYYTYYDMFKELKKSDVDGQQKAIDDKEKAGEDKAKEIKDKSRYHGPADRDLPSSTGGAFSFGDGLLGTLTTLITSLIDLDITNIRDNLYTTEYIMNMFSYATFENENYFKLVKEDGEDKLAELSLAKGGDGALIYRKVYERDTYKGAPEQDGTWLSENPENSYNKTLTNEMINEENNYAYLAEVEYILFGAGNEANVKEAYKAIYGIRYVLNLASAFLNFWGTSTLTGDIVNAAATAISSATAFIIPAPLIKLVILPILTIFETGKDMDRLEAGFPVELYKNKEEDWWTVPGSGTPKTLDGIYNALTGGGINGDEGERIKKSHGLRYSDYLTLFVFLGLNSDSSADAMYQRMANVIEKNMGLRTEEESYSLKKTKVYFRLKSKLRVEPMMMTLPLYSDYITDPAMKDDWCTFEVDTLRGY